MANRFPTSHTDGTFLSQPTGHIGDGWNFKESVPWYPKARNLFKLWDLRSASRFLCIYEPVGSPSTVRQTHNKFYLAVLFAFKLDEGSITRGLHFPPPAMLTSPSQLCVNITQQKLYIPSFWKKMCVIGMCVCTRLVCDCGHTGGPLGVCGQRTISGRHLHLWPWGMLAGPGASGNFPISTSHLTLGVLRL